PASRVQGVSPNTQERRTPVSIRPADGRRASTTIRLFPVYPLRIHYARRAKWLPCSVHYSTRRKPDSPGNHGMGYLLGIVADSPADATEVRALSTPLPS